MNLKQYQKDFSTFIRTNNQKYKYCHLPQNCDIYPRLVFNNINSSLTSCFPICYDIAKNKFWNELVQTFIQEYKCFSPLFRDLPEQFLLWLNEKKDIKLPLYFYDFAHYEWLEMIIAIAPDNKQNFQKIQSKTDFLNQKIILTDAWTIKDYYFDVHLINKKNQPKIKKAKPNYYLIFRNEMDEVKFTILNEQSVNYLSILINNEFDINKAIQNIHTLSNIEKDLITQNLLNLVWDLYNQEMVLGISDI